MTKIFLNIVTTVTKLYAINVFIHTKKISQDIIKLFFQKNITQNVSFIKVKIMKNFVIHVIGIYAIHVSMSISHMIEKV